MISSDTGSPAKFARDIINCEFPRQRLGFFARLCRANIGIGLIEDPHCFQIINGKTKERQAEIERQRREEAQRAQAREEAERRRLKAIKDSQEELSSIISAWAKTKRIEEFFADAERRVADLSDDEKRIILERLKLAREMVGGTDALELLRSWRAPDER